MQKLQDFSDHNWERAKCHSDRPSQTAAASSTFQFSLCFSDEGLSSEKYFPRNATHTFPLFWKAIHRKCQTCATMICIISLRGYTKKGQELFESWWYTHARTPYPTSFFGKANCLLCRNDCFFINSLRER